MKEFIVERENGIIKVSKRNLFFFILMPWRWKKRNKNIITGAWTASVREYMPTKTDRCYPTPHVKVKAVAFTLHKM